ncbi:MAG: hypothetical protein GY861_29150, partial [bacterium]|nr:hypothetical protein [bacterium]
MLKIDLNTYTYTELKVMANELHVPIRRSKIELIKEISQAFKEYETYKKDKLDRYTRIRLLGNGKEGTTYLVETNGKEYAMKTFRKQKSSNTLRKEAELQNMAAEMGVSPRVVDVDTVSKYIVMEKLDRHLYDVLKKNKGIMSQNI